MLALIVPTTSCSLLLKSVLLWTARTTSGCRFLTACTAILDMTGSYMRANQRSWTSGKVKWQVNLTPRWTEARSLVWKEMKNIALHLDKRGFLGEDDQGQEKKEIVGIALTVGIWALHPELLKIFFSSVRKYGGTLQQYESRQSYSTLWPKVKEEHDTIAKK